MPFWGLCTEDESKNAFQLFDWLTFDIFFNVPTVEAKFINCPKATFAK